MGIYVFFRRVVSGRNSVFPPIPGEQGLSLCHVGTMRRIFARGQLDRRLQRITIHNNGRTCISQGLPVTPGTNSLTVLRNDRRLNLRSWQRISSLIRGRYTPIYHLRLPQATLTHVHGDTSFVPRRLTFRRQLTSNSRVRISRLSTTTRQGTICLAY